MKTLTIRNIPDDVYNVVYRVAKRNHRSLQQQVMVFLEKARMLETESPADKALAIRQQLKNRELGDTVQEVRSERQR